VVPVLQGPLRGKRWIVGSATHGCWLGTYERQKSRAFGEAVRPGMVVFDLGANVGFYTLLAAAKTGNDGRVYAFEPLPRNVAFLRRHLAHNGFNNVAIVEAAVSDAPGTAAFEEGSNSCQGRLGDSGRLTVPTVTLDQMVLDGGIPPPEVIKIDIEGGEWHALSGARQVLRTHHPTVFLATHGARLHADCCSLLRELGYTMRGVDGSPVSETDELIAWPPRAETAMR
jgi:FkbM family methyltransferase